MTNHPVNILTMQLVPQDIKPNSQAGKSNDKDATHANEPHPSRSRWRWMRRALVLIAVFAFGAVAGSMIFGGGAPVGHFTSADGYEAYLTAYDEALAEGPAPDGVLDVRTAYGVVHMVRYDGPDPDADPLVLLPGTQSGAPMWVDNIPSLTASRTVYVVDLLAQPGLSVQAKPLTSAEDDAAWLAQALDAIPGDPSVLGHSLGGWIAMNLAIHEPDAAASIIVLDPVLTFADLSFDAIVRSIPASVPWTPRSWRDGFASWTANDAPVEDEPVADMIEAGMQHYALGAPAQSRFTETQLAEVEVPVLVVMAGASRMHDSAAAAAYAEQVLPDAEVRTYDGASHAIIGEEPERLATDIDAFLTARQN